MQTFLNNSRNILFLGITISGVLCSFVFYSFLQVEVEIQEKKDEMSDPLEAMLGEIIYQ